MEIFFHVAGLDVTLWSRGTVTASLGILLPGVIGLVDGSISILIRAMPHSILTRIGRLVSFSIQTKGTLRQMHTCPLVRPIFVDPIIRHPVFDASLLW